MKYKRIPVKRLFEASECVGDLERILARNNITFESEKQLRRFLKWNWQRENREEILRAYQEPVEPVEELPFVEYKTGPMNVKIYGVAHGGLGMSVGHKLKRLVKKTYDANKFEFSHWRIEPGLARIFDLDEKDEMVPRFNSADPQPFKPNALNLAQTMNYLLLWSLRRVEAITFLGQTGINMIKACTDPAYIGKLQKILDASALPAPFETLVNEACNDPLTIYGRNMAQYLRSRQCMPEFQQNALVGLGHVQEIVDFLDRYERNHQIWKNRHRESSNKVEAA